MSASVEQRCVLLLARGTLSGEEQTRAHELLGQPLAWPDIARSADEHGVVPTVVRNLRRLGWPQIPEAIRKDLESAERLNAVRNRLLARSLVRTLDRFAHARIPVIALKGVALAESLYGDMSLRVCSDVDILVPRHTVGQAVELLEADGFKGADRYRAGAGMDLLLRSNMEYCLDSPPGSFRYVLELHWDIAWRWRADAEMIEHLWADARRGTVLGAEAWVLSAEWELLYLAFHAARHRWSALKWLVDVHEICVRGGIDWAGVQDRSQRFGLERALHLTLAACRTLLDTPLPPALEGHAPPRRLRVLRAAPVTVGGWLETLSAVRLFSRSTDRLRYLGRLLLRPTLAEWSLVRLPSSLRFLYYGLRPLRLGIASGRAMVRAGLGRLDLRAKFFGAPTSGTHTVRPADSDTARAAGEESAMHRGEARRVVRTLLLCLLTLSLSRTPAMAFDLGQWIPGLKVSPFLSEKIEYESNVFQVPSHSQGDEIFRTIPGVLADYTFGPHSVSAGYRAEILNYVNLTDQNTVNHIAAGLLRLDFPRTLLTLREDFVRTNFPPGTELTGPVISNTNVVKPEGEYRLTPRFGLGLNYSWTHVTFDQQSISTLINRDDQLVGTSFFWHFVPKASLFLNYSYGWTTFSSSSDGNRNYTSNNVTVGLRGDMTAKLSSSLQVGYTIENPESSTQTQYNGLIVSGDTTYRPTERITLTLSTQRARQESTFGTNAFYVTSNATLAGSYQILPKLTLTARLGGGINNYSTKQFADGMTDFRRDTFLLAGSQLDYDIQPWLRAGLEYARISRDSNFPSFRFVDDRISGRVTVQF